MRKVIRIGFPIVCVGIIVITFWMLNDIKKKVQNKEENNVANETEDVVENNLENSLENQVNNLVSNELSNETASFFGTETDVNVSKAIYILKDQIEIDEQTYYLTSEGEENGKYIIAVRNSETTVAQQYYIIDIEKQNVEIYY